MLPNERTIAVVFVALLLAQVMPIASAQTTGPDLYVETIYTGTNAVVDRATTVSVVVINRGTSTFSGSFTVFISQAPSGDCLDRNDPPTPTGNPNDPFGQQGCNIQALNANIIAGANMTFTFTWTPQSAQAGNLNVWSRICGGTSGTLSPTGCTGPETSTAAQQNNFRNDHFLFVHHPAVDAVARREIPPHAGATIDSPWREANITESCPVGQDVVIRIGCHARPGRSLLYQYDILNLGNSQDALRISLEGTGVPFFERLGYKFVLSSTVMTVQPTPPNQPPQPRTVGLTIEVPSNATFNQMLNVNFANMTLKVTSGLNPEISTETSGNPPLPSIIIARNHGLSVTTNDTLRIANATEEVVYKLRLNNTGNAQDTYSVRFLHGTGTINGSWSLPAPHTVTVAGLSAYEHELRLRPPTNATKGIHEIDVEIFSTIEDKTSDAYHKQRIVADLQQHFAIDAYSDPGLISRLPADTASFAITVRNDGNWYDNVTLDLSPMPPGWTGGLSQRVVPVAPLGNTTTVWLNVTPPPNAPRGTDAHFYINGTSSGPTDRGFDQRAKISQMLISQVRVLEGSNLDLIGGGPAVFIDAGRSFDFGLRVTNTGNVRDRFTVSLAPDDPTWAASSPVTSVELDPLQGADIPVTVRAPASGNVGDSASVLVKVASLVDSSRERTVSLSGRISGPDLFVDAINLNTSNPYAGDPLEIAVVYGNSGNKAPNAGVNVTMRLVFSQGGVEREIASKTLTPEELPGGIRRSERFVWEDTLSAEGAGVLIARIDVDDLVKEIDESEASNEASLAVTLRTFEIRVRPAQGLEGRPGEKVSYSESPHAFVVEYRGNQPTEPVRIRLVSENGWGSRDFNVSLPRNTELEVLVDLQIPLMPLVASDTLRLIVTPALRPTGEVRAATTTNVLDDAPPRIGGIVITPETAAFGEDVKISAIVSDATGLRSVRAYIVTPLDETKIIPLVKGEGDTWTATQAFTAAGLHRLYVEAIDGSNAANVNSTREAPVSFAITPGSVPSIKLADGQSSTIRTGSILRLNITDPLGIARVTYTVRGIEYALAAPYHIETASFQPGPVNLSVKAANIYDAETTQRFDLTVDNTPPGIQRVTITPEKPKINEEVKIVITTDANVQGVDVIVKRDGTVIETRAAIKQRDGVFELTLSPGQGDYVLDVSAKDAAGNTMLQERAVLFSAKPASFIPGPGLALVALVGVAAALLVRRR